QVFDHADGAVHGAADAAGEPDNLAPAIADETDAVQRALDAGAVVIAEIADVVDHELQVVFGDLFMAEHHFAAGGAGLGQPAEVHHDLKQVGAAFGRAQRLDDARRESIEQQVEVIGDDLFVGKHRGGSEL